MTDAFCHVVSLDLLEGLMDMLNCIEGLVIDQVMQSHFFVVALYY